MIRIAVPALAALLVMSACAGSSAPQQVPTGCEPTPELVTWQDPTTTSILTRATLIGGDHAYQQLLEEPYEPGITGVEAPASWPEQLAASLQDTVGHPVMATDPSVTGTSGLSADSQTRIVVYVGVDRISADFEVDCDPTVSGTFHGWSSAVDGAAFCGPGQPTQPTEFDRLARELCPPPTPAESGPVDAEPFPDSFTRPAE